MKIKKTIVSLCSIVFILLSFHLGYQYVQAISPKVPTKGGTIVEGILGKLSYLPYTSANATDEFYQHLLFKGCVKTIVSGTSVTHVNDLCEVITRDYKNYFVTLPNTYRWIDDKPFTLDDVIFTYQTILKDNYWKMPILNAFSKTEITRVDDNTVKVSFPKQSVDNILFFANSLLPKHILEGQTLEYYLKTFAKQPIYISCAVLDLVKSHDSNYVFDVTSCSEYYPKVLQVKSFDDEVHAVKYLQNKDSIVDFINVDIGKSEQFQPIKNIFTGVSMPTNTIYTLFFNVNTVGDSLRKAIANNLSTLTYDNLLYHKTLFSFQSQTGISLKDVITNQVISSGSASGTLNVAFPFLPKNIRIFGKNKYKEYYLDEQRDKYLIQFKFDTKYDKITIAANGPYEYTPDSYDAENKTCAYNLSTQFKNIQKGVNTYNIYGYLNGTQNKLLTMTVHYGIKPNTTPLLSKKTNYTIVYLDEPNSRAIVENLKQEFLNQGIDNYITRSSYSNFSEFEGKLASKGYDMALLPLELGLKSDLSALFSDNTVLNPSQYTNDRMSQLLQKYTNGDKAATNEIISIYQKIYPFVMLGSLKQVLYIKSTYGEKVVDDYTTQNFRQNMINTLKTYETVVLDKDILFELQNITDYITEKLSLRSQ